MGKPEQSLSDGGNAGVSASSTPNGRRKRVLLIEDDSLAGLVLLHRLRVAGFDVDVAANGYLAMEKLRTLRPEAIFMDLMLPYVKGADVIKEARRDPEFAHCPIYVCTSKAHMNAWIRQG